MNFAQKTSGILKKRLSGARVKIPLARLAQAVQENEVSLPTVGVRYNRLFSRIKVKIIVKPELFCRRFESQVLMFVFVLDKQNMVQIKRLGAAVQLVVVGPRGAAYGDNGNDVLRGDAGGISQ